jgi:hypothetical protein
MQCAVFSGPKSTCITYMAMLSTKSSVPIPPARLIIAILIEVNGTTAMVLLEAVARKEAEKLDNNTFDGICRGPALIGVQHSSTNVLAEDVRMVHITLYGHHWSAKRIVLRKLDGQMKRVRAFRNEY